MNDQIKAKNSGTSPESFRDRLTTVDASGKRKWVFAQKPKGTFYSIRTWVSRGFFILFFALPFIKVNDRPLFLFNIPEAKFILFGKIFWPQDFFILGLTMITFIVFVVLFTAAFGRLFCGWVCPQTIFMEMLFRKIEYFIEGDAAKQRILKNAPWTEEKIRKKLTKNILFYLLAFIIANFFLSYIIGMDELEKIVREPITMHVGGLSAILVFSGVFFGVYTYFREQVCTVICPYGRLQSVLLDPNSMIVAYDYKRGEPRSKFTKEADPSIHRGDCIDCFQCVKVCPTAIDIRNGLQMECVGCTACIDACNAIMDATKKDRGLIRYASENGLAGSTALKYTVRMKLYTVLLFVLAGILSFLLISRKNVDGTIVRSPGILYQERGKDSISNLYVVKVINKTRQDIPITLRVENAPGRIIEAEGRSISVAKEGQGTGSFFIVLPNSFISDRKTKLEIGLYQGDERITILKTNFMGPFNKF